MENVRHGDARLVGVSALPVCGRRFAETLRWMIEQGGTATMLIFFALNLIRLSARPGREVRARFQNAARIRLTSEVIL
jgi:hypothetical protein